MTLHDATAAQIAASDPLVSTWLSANAGSGKTRVLTDRVARLLLGGVEPSRVLCLTYTKAAASEMQNRLFATLGSWAMKPEEDLRAALAELGETDRLDGPSLASARRLFARAIETPGGLRIQTIHSFCAALLRRFPLEAGVSPLFTELDDRSARMMREEIVEEMSDHLAPAVMARFALAFTGDDLFKLVEEVAANRSEFGNAVSVAKLFNLPDGESDARILADTFLGGEGDWMPRLIAGLEASGKSTDATAASRLKALDLAVPALSDLAVLEDIFLFKADAAAAFCAKVGAFPTKPVQMSLPDLLPGLNALMQRVEAARARRLCLAAAQKTETLHAFATTFLPLYAERKTARGWLDFDDLIKKTKALLTDPNVTAWILYHLDTRIDHVLVDEAQDTSPDQWRIIELLTSEFSAGQGQHIAPRTIFVVGDKKQSIYSFQGADVTGFDAKQADFQHKFEDSGQVFQSRRLDYSFRSSPAILQIVDRALGDRFPQVPGPDVLHKAIRNLLPGRVDLWPLIANEKATPDDKFEDPVDLIRETHATVRLAERIANEIRRMIDEKVLIPAKEGIRPVHAGDFLILVQRRSGPFAEIIRACKALLLPIAGADRLKLGAEMAVKDLLALFSFLVTPEDDLSLAACLRSPLFGWTERELYELARGRPGYLWQALRTRNEHQATLDRLNDLLARADFLSPFDLLERTLIHHDGRRRLVARLGPEAEDGIDELLNQALAYERSEAPSLTGFLAQLITDDVEIKRQADGSGGRIRIMTVHGAKGLESEIVILPDTADRPILDKNEILLSLDNIPLWKVSKDESPLFIANLRAQKAAREAAENRRLLYVAMTRARCWLIVAGAGFAKKEGAWHQIISAASTALGAENVDDFQRFATGAWPLLNELPKTTPSEIATLPEWVETQPAAFARAAPLQSPSGISGLKALPGEADALSEGHAKARGTAIHLLLQHLPEWPKSDWPNVARFLIPDSDLRVSAFRVAANVLDSPRFAALFGAASLAEVPISGPIHGRLWFGVIDRLVFSPGQVLATDFKSNELVPAGPDQTPVGLLRQIGIYVLLLEQVFPGRKIQPAILWTATPHLMYLDADIVRQGALLATMDGTLSP